MAESPVSVQDAGSAVLVSFRSNSMLDTLTVEAIGDELLALARQPAKRGIVLDFGNVQFVSSPALSMLLKLRRDADKSGGEVVLCGLSDEIARLFRITRLDKLFLFFDSPEAALARFAPPSEEHSTAR